MSRYIAVQVWAAYIDNVSVSAPDVDQLAEFVENRLNDADMAYISNPELESNLVRIGEEYMRGKYPNLFKNS
jgi:hypothetical protein